MKKTRPRALMTSRSGRSLAGARPHDDVMVILSDQALSQIRIKQTKKQLAMVGTDFKAAEYVKLAEAFGGSGVSVDSESEYADALGDALRSNRFTLIQARIDPSQHPAQFDAVREL